MLKQGIKKKDVVHQLGVNKNTVTNWWRSYQEHGNKSYHYSKSGVKSEDKKLLTEAQELAIKKMIVDKMPNQLKLNFALWTRKAVKELVEHEFGVILAVNTMGDYLRKWGYIPQKPKQRVYEQCSKKVRQWLDEVYPKIKTQIKETDAELHWAEERGLKNHYNHGKSYTPKEGTPVKTSMSKHFSLNMVSSVTNQGKVQFMLYSTTINTDKFIEFLEQLIKSTDKKLYVILDNLKIHHCKIVKQWAENNKDKIALFFLPSSAP